MESFLQMIHIQDNIPHSNFLLLKTRFSCVSFDMSDKNSSYIPPNVGNETPHWGVMFPTLWGKNQGQEI